MLRRHRRHCHLRIAVCVGRLRRGDSADPRTEALVRCRNRPRWLRIAFIPRTMAARVQSDLQFRVSGLKVLERLVDAGQAVKRGQPLMLSTLSISSSAAAGQQRPWPPPGRGCDRRLRMRRYRDLRHRRHLFPRPTIRSKAAADAAKAQLQCR